MQLVFEKSQEGRRGIVLDPLDVPEKKLSVELTRAEDAALPELSEFDVVRHFTELSNRNFGLDSHLWGTRFSL